MPKKAAAWAGKSSKFGRSANALLGAFALGAVFAVGGCVSPSTGASTSTQITTQSSPTPDVSASESPSAPEVTTAPATSAPPTTAPAPAPETQAPAPAPAPAQTTTAATQSLCGAPANPFGYNFCGRGGYIYSPDGSVCSYFHCIANFHNGTGYMVECHDGTYSMSGGKRGACSYHGGELRPVYSG